MLPQNAVYSDLSTIDFTVSFRKRHQKNRQIPQNMEEIRQQTAAFRCNRDMLRRMAHVPLRTENHTRPTGVRNSLIIQYGRGKLLNVLPLDLFRALWISCGILARAATDFFSLQEYLGSLDCHL